MDDAIECRALNRTRAMNRARAVTVRAAGWLVAGLFTQAAVAGPLPAAAFSVTAGPASSTGVFGGGAATTVTSHSCYYPWNTGMCSANASASTNLAVTVSGSVRGSSYISAQAVMNYSVEVAGPVGSTLLVPLNIIGSAMASEGSAPGAPYTSAAYIAVTDAQNTRLVNFSVCAAAPGSWDCFGPSIGSLNTSFNVTANTVFKVGLEATGSIGGVTAQPSTIYGFSASADPVITIAPAFLAANPGYSIITSANISTPVPEPATAWTLALGLACLALFSQVPQQGHRQLRIARRLSRPISGWISSNSITVADQA